ncbi:MAG: shikimate kinase [Candidatus Dormibacteria bacterium]
MGTGKSSVAGPLARRLDLPAVDLDQVIEASEGVPVAELLARGEPGFREIESRCLRRVLDAPGAVVLACGGGTPLAADNLRMMREQGVVVALTASNETVLGRIGAGDSRPLLRPDPASRVAELQLARRARYLQADLVVATDDLNPDEVAARVAEDLSKL